MRFFRRSNNKLYDYFQKQADCLVAASGYILDLVNAETVSERKELYRSIKLCETQGDAILSTIYDEIMEDGPRTVNREFVQSIASKMDEFLDRINDSARRVLIYVPKRIDHQVIELAEYIKEDALVIKSIINEYSTAVKKHTVVLKYCERITQLEHASDDVFGEYMTFLFENEKDAIELIKYKNIIEAFEDTTDCAKDIADLVRKMALFRK